MKLLMSLPDAMCLGGVVLSLCYVCALYSVMYMHWCMHSDLKQPIKQNNTGSPSQQKGWDNGRFPKDIAWLSWLLAVE